MGYDSVLLQRKHSLAACAVRAVVAHEEQVVRLIATELGVGRHLVVGEESIIGGDNLLGIFLCLFPLLEELKLNKFPISNIFF